MRTALNALTDELRRLKATGLKSVNVSEESLALLRKAVAGRRTEAPSVAASSAQTEQKPAIFSPTVPNPTATASAPPIRSATTAPVRVASTVVVPAAAPVSKLPPPPTVALPAGDKATRWAALLALVTNDPVCRAQARPGKKVVLGVGNLDAQIMFVGEAPGAEEEIQGEPFVGPAGQLLTKMISGMGLQRSDVYIGNIMNWRPDLPTAEGASQVGNRPPTQEEMLYCLPFLRAQIEIVQPSLLIALGSTAAQGLLGFGTFKALGEVRGQWKEFAGKPLMVTYHPSYILRSQTNRSKRMIWEDLLKVMERAPLPISDKQRAYFLEK